MRLATSNSIKGRLVVFVAVLAGFLLSAFVLPLPICAAGEIVGWGRQKPPNVPLTNLTQIAAGLSHSLALKSDGSISGWGENDAGQATPPSGTDFVAIAAGIEHSLALKSDGSIVGWGHNYYGQATPPDGNDFVAIAAGRNHSLAIRYVCQYAIAGDFNIDCGVDWQDVAILCDQWLSYEIPYDVAPDGGDGIVNFADWPAFASNWQSSYDIFDLAEFVSQWLKTGANYCIADIAPESEGDGIVNMVDFAVLAENWMAGE